jgi:hypothetical protein
MTRPREVTEIHTRLLRCATEIDASRQYWRHAAPGAPSDADHAHAGWWFGDKSLDRVRVLLQNLRARFDAFPPSLAVLHGWRDLDAPTASLICHLHLQLSDPLYRSFTGDLLVARRDGLRAEVHLDQVVAFVTDQGPGRWTLATRVQFASKLLSCALTAGLVHGRRDYRQLTWPKLTDDALSYLLYLLREVDFEGTLLDNPYLASLGLRGEVAEARLRQLADVRVRRLGDVVDVDWSFPSLAAWAEARGHRATEEGP